METKEIGRLKRICSNLGKVAVTALAFGAGMILATIYSVKQYSNTDVAVTMGIVSALSISVAILVLRVRVPYCERLEYMEKYIKRKQITCEESN